MKTSRVVAAWASLAVLGAVVGLAAAADPDVGGPFPREIERRAVQSVFWFGYPGAQPASFTPDGRYVYVSEADGHAAAFARAPRTGELGFISRVGGECSAVFGDNLYSAGGGIDVMSRDAVSGAPTLIQHLGAAQVLDIAVAPDGAHVYTAVHGGQWGVEVYARAAHGTLTAAGFWNGTAAGYSFAAALRISPDGRFVYLYGGKMFFADKVIAVLARDEASGALTLVEERLLDRAFHSSFDMSADGAFLYGGAGPDVFQRDSLDGTLTFAGSTAGGPWEQLLITSDGAHAYATRYDGNLDAARIEPLARNATSGALTATGASLSIPGPYLETLSIDPAGETLYYFTGAAPGQPDGQVMRRDPSSGNLTPSSAFEGSGAVHPVALSPDGAFLYRSQFKDDSIEILSVAPDGVPTVIGADGPSQVRDGLTSIVLSPGGEHLYACSRNVGSLSAFSRDGTSGALTELQVLRDGIAGVDGLAGAQSLAVSPDGVHVLVAAREDGALGIFQRNPTSGALTYLARTADGDPGVDGLAGASDVAVSADSAHVYAAGYEDDALAAFSLDASTGALTPVGVYRDAGGALDGSSSVAVSPTGTHVYVLATRGASLSWYSRNATTGALTFAGRATAHGQSLSMSGDGRWLATSGGNAEINPIEIFQRDTTTGSLTYHSRKAFEGVYLYMHDGATFNADGRFLYAEGASFALAGWCPVSPRPAVSCRQAGAASLLLKDKANDRSDRAQLIWKRGDTTAPAAFATTSGPKAFSLCVYDSSGREPFAIGVPSQGPCDPDSAYAAPDCWRAYFEDWVYRQAGQWNGLRSVRLRPDGSRPAMIKLLSKGDGVSAMPALPLVAPVRAQFVAADGECWEASFAGSDIRRNVPGLFRAAN